MVKILKNLVWAMFPWVMVRREINKIIREDYGNYEGKLQKQFQPVHKHLRQAKGDSWFLHYLKYRRIENPKPNYSIPDLDGLAIDFPSKNPWELFTAINPFCKDGFEKGQSYLIFHEPMFPVMHSTARGGKAVVAVNHDPKLLWTSLNWDKANRDLTNLACKISVDPELLPVLYRGPIVTTLAITEMADIIDYLDYFRNKMLANAGINAIREPSTDL